MKKVITILFALICFCSSYAQRPTLKFHDGHFKILQITDLHLIEGETYVLNNDSTYALISNMIDLEKPDIVMLTGDCVVSWGARNGWEKLTKIFIDKKVPFAVAFGNHDEETDMNNAQILDYLKSNPYNMGYDEEKLSGSGNCSLPVLSSDGKTIKWVLYVFDSHNNTKDRSLGYYSWIKHDQIDWYRRTSDAYAQKNNKIIPSLVFFHIPLFEFESAKWACGKVGNDKEGVCAPNVNSGLFESFIDKKDVIGVFVGHDHNDDYLIDVNGKIALAYGRKTGYNSAYDEVLERGCRVINLTENEARYNTYIEDLKGKYFNYTFEQKNHSKDYPVANGTFIQESLVSGWDDARWDKEMLMLRNAGMKYLIYAPALLVDGNGKTSSSYPSSLVKKNRHANIIASCLKSAQKNGIRVFLGMNFNDRWWKVDYDEAWLASQMEQGNKVADELTRLYKKKYPDAMYGWYWVWEVDNAVCTTPERQAALAKILNINLDHLSKITPDMPLMLSPFVNYRVGNNAKKTGEMWKNVFAQTHFRCGDIFSPQDCIGAGGLNLDNLDEWTKELYTAVRSKEGLKFWSNIETFDQNYWCSGSLSRIVKQLSIVNPYVSNIISFAYSHYYSPYQVNKHYDEAYRYYVQHGEIPQMKAPGKIDNLKKEQCNEGVRLSWNCGEPDMTAGYNIYRNNELIHKLLIRINDNNSEFIDKSGKISDVYSVSAYNVNDNESEKVLSQN